MKRGALIIVLAPSGSGKGTLVAHARSVFPDLSHTISCTTRSPRPGEIDGVDYYFLTREEFTQRVEEGKFLEWAEYGGNLYGTLVSEVEDRLARGEYVMLEIEVQGARNIKKLFPENAFVIYIDAGEWKTLERRIRDRAPITDKELAKRKEGYELERPYLNEAEYVVENKDGELEQAKEAFIEAIRSIKENTVA